jgi:hypothetical protein
VDDPAQRRDNVRAMATPESPQRVCPRCSSLARTPHAHCPFCGRSYRRRSPLPAILLALLATAAASIGGTALMLTAFGDELDRELEDQVDVVQRDLDRDVRRIERTFERELDERLPAVPGP